ncbi:MAG: TIGR04255 family protein [Aliidongia sp.]
MDDFDPLFGEPQMEIPLPESPLTYVVAQLQFEPIMQLGSQEFIAPLQEQVRSDYPKLERQQIQIPNLLVGGESQTEFLWRFQSVDSGWRLAISRGFLALETRIYTSRSDFMRRFKEAIAIFKATVKTAHVIRLGVRYVDHIRPPAFDQLADMIHPGMLGILNTRLRPDLQYGVNEITCQATEGTLVAKWGLLPANGTHDPNAIEPIPGQQSWFLDIDAFKHYAESPQQLDVDAMHELGISLATRSYAFFRWATTETLLRTYGAKL